MSVINTVLTCHHMHYVIPNNKTIRAITQQSRRGKNKVHGRYDVNCMLIFCLCSEQAVCVLVRGSNVDVMWDHTYSPPVFTSLVQAVAGLSTGYHSEVSARSLEGDTKQGVHVWKKLERNTHSG